MRHARRQRISGRHDAIGRRLSCGDCPACEREHYKDYDWYPRYGMVYYNFLKDRYTRK